MVDKNLRLTLLTVIVLNSVYFFVEFGVALAIGSVSLLADSIDFLEDAIVNSLVLWALGWTMRSRALAGKVFSGIMLIPATITLVMIFRKLQTQEVPEAITLSVVGLGALAVNLACAFVLVRFRNRDSSLLHGAWLWARNDAIMNILIIIAGIITAFRASMWPDLLAGLVIFLVNATAAVEVYKKAHEENLRAQFEEKKSCC